MNPQVQARAGQSFIIQGSATDVNGQQVPLDVLQTGLAWYSDNIQCCTVTPNALGSATVQCVGTGNATIHSRFGNVTAGVDVVVGAALENLVLTPSTPS